MQASQAAIDLIKQFEGCKLQSYQDQKGIWTVGYGCTGPGIDASTLWNQSQANQALVARVNTIARILTGCVVPPKRMSQHMFDAMVSLCYNIGQGAFRGSTLLKLVNQGDFDGAANEFLKWDHVDGVVDPGLLTRRQAEQSLFLSP